MTQITAKTSKALTGDITVPGDKSISHRSLIFGALGVGTSQISGLLEGEDVLNTKKALEQMGVKIEKKEQDYFVEGVGVSGLAKSENILDMGNSGTGIRLMMGLVAPFDFDTEFTGDDSLRKRPMGRIVKPLEQMGANFVTSEGGRAPLKVLGGELMPAHYNSPVASAQVKSAILLAGLNTPGKTSVTEPRASRDHSENMLSSMGANVTTEELEDGARKITIEGFPDLKSAHFQVPADPSSAAFVTAAALLIEGSDVVIRNVCMNPLRDGFFECVREMGADIAYENERTQNGERIVDVHVKHSALKGITVPASRVPSMIDEFPILSVLASFAEGQTEMRDIEELRVKESDRIGVMAAGLKEIGVDLEEGKDFLIIKGFDKTKAENMTIDSQHDHRIAMSFLIMGSALNAEITVTGAQTILTSFPNFVELMNGLGTNLEIKK